MLIEHRVIDGKNVINVGVSFPKEVEIFIEEGAVILEQDETTTRIALYEMRGDQSTKVSISDTVFERYDRLSDIKLYQFDHKLYGRSDGGYYKCEFSVRFKPNKSMIMHINDWPQPIPSKRKLRPPDHGVHKMGNAIYMVDFKNIASASYVLKVSHNGSDFQILDVGLSKIAIVASFDNCIWIKGHKDTEVRGSQYLMLLERNGNATTYMASNDTSIDVATEYGLIIYYPQEGVIFLILPTGKEYKVEGALFTDEKRIKYRDNLLVLYNNTEVTVYSVTDRGIQLVGSRSINLLVDANTYVNIKRPLGTTGIKRSLGLSDISFKF